MPSDDGFRFDDEQDIGPTRPKATECGPKQAVASFLRRPGSLAFEHGELLAESEDLKRGIGPCPEESPEGNQDGEQELKHELTVLT